MTMLSISSATASASHSKRASFRSRSSMGRLILLLFAYYTLLWSACDLQAQFNPATGPVNTDLTFTSDSSQTHGAFSVSRDGKKLTITRPGQANYVYTAPGDSSAILSYAFIGPSTILLRTVDANPVDVRIFLELVNMNTFTSGQPAVSLINRQFFVSDSPNLNLQRNSDGQVLFTFIVTADAPTNDTFELDLYRTDTGAHLCSLANFNRDPGGDMISASVTGTDVNIHVNRDSFPDLDSTCQLPAPDLTVDPDPLDFGEILSTDNATNSVALYNPGTDTITINAIATAGAFSAVGFVPVTLVPGESESASILFNPSGVVGNFNESLPITRTPALGAAFIDVEGSTRAPVPELSLSGSTNFGCVNVGASPIRTFTISSTGDLPVTVLSIAGPAAAQYTLTTPPGFTIGSPIPVGNSFTFTVTFSPTAPGLLMDTITISSNDPDNPNRVVTLSGTGHIPQADFVIDPTLTNLNYGEVEAGYRFGKGVRIVNNGDRPLSFQVDVLGDPRFNVSTDVNTPGPGSTGPIGITIPGSLNPCGGGTPTDIILRVTFDATLPEGGPFNGTLRISNIAGDPNPPTQPVDINLSGSVIAAKTVDIALVLDRSGSMAQPMAIGTKESAVRSASRLFIELMRPDIGDRMALIQFNTTVDVFQEIIDITEPSRTTLVDAVEDLDNLAPTGGTSIAGGLFEAFPQLNDPSKDIRAAFVVSDGNDNTPYHPPSGGEIDLSTLTVPAGIGVHALCIGTGTNTNLGILAAIAESTGGRAVASDNVTALGVFDIEKFFLQTATTILGGNTTLDPVDKIYPGQEKIWQVELIPADKEVNFVLIYKFGVLPYVIEAPDGTLYPLSSPPPGFGLAVHEPPVARIVRIQLPTDEPERYSGIWKVKVQHGGKLVVAYPKGKTHDGTTEGTHTVSYSDPVDYALAVSVFSNLRLLAYVSPQPLYLGDPITVTGVLSEEEVPVTGATIEVNVRFPDAVTTRSLKLYDDGLHNDGQAADGVYANDFTETIQEGHYQFAYHAFGQSGRRLSARRQSNFVRETSVGQYVTRQGRVPGDETHPGWTPAGCCVWLAIIAALLLLIFLLIWLCCRRTRLAIAQQK